MLTLALIALFALAESFWHHRPQWHHQTLYRSRKGRYYVVHESQWQGSMPHAEWISPEEAARWLLANDEELPEDLEQYADEVSE